jgi:uncharacterized protein (TIGR02646 family)
LASVRDGDHKAKSELARVRALGSPSSDEIGDKYRVVAEDLWHAQGHKCAYCEGLEQRKRNDVEHFRPKGRIDDCAGNTLTPGYWWLAWSWSNLLFSCRNCNQSPAKLDKFPIDPGSVRLKAEEEPPGQEKAVLLDPYIDEPMDHIVFRLARFGLQDRWTPQPRNGSTRGKRTIEILLLDRDDLSDLYQDHVKDYIEPDVAELKHAISQSNLTGVQHHWKTLIRMVQRGRPFTALAHDAIDFYVPQSIRDQWGLLLERPR